MKKTSKPTEDCESWYELETALEEETSMDKGLIEAVKQNWMVWSMVWTVGYCVGMYVHMGMPAH